MAKQQQQKAGKGCRKAGRNKAICERYRLRGIREKNKARKQKKIAKILARKLARKQNKG